MICGKHEDGRIILMAKEHNLKPMIFFPQSINWEHAMISGRELDEFDDIDSKPLIHILLTDALRFAEKHPEFKIVP